MARAVGIDVGSDGVRVVELERKGTTMRVRRYIHFSRSELQSKGIEDATAASESLARVLVAECAVRGVSLRNPVALGITGRESIVRYMNVPPMPPWRLKLVMSYEIQESSAKAGEKLQADFRLVPVPRETFNELTCLIAMVKDEPVQARLDAFQRGGINVDALLPNSIAIANAWHYLGTPSDTAGKAEIVFDLGARNAEVGMSVAGDVIFARSMVSGGELFTERLAASWNMDPDTAEQCKRRGKGPGGEELGQGLRSSFSQVGNLINASFNFAKTQLRAKGLELERVVMTGGASRTRGLGEAMGDSLGVEIDVFDPMETLEPTGDASAADREAMSVLGREATVACGLAASMLRPNAFTLDLLPEAYRKRREFRTQTVWLYAAAAALLVYAGFTTVFALSRKSEEQKVNAEAVALRDDVQTRLDDLEEVEQENRRQVHTLGNLVRRTQSGYHLGHLMSLLNTELPPRLTIRQITLEEDPDATSGAAPGRGRRRSRRAEPEDEEALPEGPPPYVVTLQGEADDADGEGRDAVTELERLLRRDGEVREARQTKVSKLDKEAKLDFTILLRFRG